MVLAVALPIFLAASIPIAGWITGTGLYLAQRLVRAFTAHKAEKADDPRTTVGLLAGSMIARGWIVAGAILAVGLTTDSATGLSASVLFLAAFTMALTMALATGGANAGASVVAAGPLPKPRRTQPAPEQEEQPS
jgi:hypothetical protein